MKLIYRKGTVEDKDKLQALGVLSYSKHQSGIATENWNQYYYVLLFPNIFSQGVNYQWIKEYGNAGDREFRDIVVDNSGNIYSVGSFQGSVDLGLGPGSHKIKN